MSETIDQEAENERARLGGNNPPEPTVVEPDRDKLFIDITKLVEDMATKGSALPTVITTEEQLTNYAEVVNPTRRLIKTVEEKRGDANKPYREVIERNNTFFGAMTARLDRMKKVLEDRATDYNNRKAAEERVRRAAEADRLREEAAAALAAAAAAAPGVQAEVAKKEAEIASDNAVRAHRDAGASTADMARTRTTGGTVTSTAKLDFRVADYDAIDLRELKSSFSTDAIDKAIRDHLKKNKRNKPLKGVELFENNKASFRG